MVPSLPGMTTSQLSRSCVPSASVTGLATKPWSRAEVAESRSAAGWPKDGRRERFAAHVRMILPPRFALLLQASACNTHRRASAAGRAREAAAPRSVAAGWRAPPIMAAAASSAPTAGAAFHPGQPMLDTAGHQIDAHGGGFLLDAGVYYWYGSARTDHPDPPGNDTGMFTDRRSLTKLLDFLACSFGGGTDVAGPLRRELDVLEHPDEDDVMYAGADMRTPGTRCLRSAYGFSLCPDPTCDDKDTMYNFLCIMAPGRADHRSRHMWLTAQTHARTAVTRAGARPGPRSLGSSAAMAPRCPPVLLLRNAPNTEHTGHTTARHTARDRARLELELLHPALQLVKHLRLAEHLNLLADGVHGAAGGYGWRRLAEDDLVKHPPHLHVRRL